METEVPEDDVLCAFDVIGGVMTVGSASAAGDGQGGDGENVLLTTGWEKNEDNSVCFPESSFQYFAAKWGTSRDSFIFMTSRSFKVSPDPVTISSCRSMKMGQWSEPFKEGSMSPCLNQGKSPLVSKK